MNLKQLLTRIRGMKDRAALNQIIHAAENRDGKLSDIESAKERTRLWAKFLKQGIKVGDMVFVHTGPKLTERKGKPVMESFMSSTHSSLWAKALTVREIKTRSKKIVVRSRGSTNVMSDLDTTLSAFTIDKYKLSLTPTAAALAAGLKKHEAAPTLSFIMKNRPMPKNKGSTIIYRRYLPYKGTP